MNTSYNHEEELYLQGWERYAHENPEGFSEYLLESSQIERGLNEALESTTLDPI